MNEQTTPAVKFRNLLRRVGRFFRNLRNLVVFTRRVGRRKTGGGECVFIMVYSLSGGGAERVACVLASEMAKRFHVVLIYRREDARTYPLDPAVERVPLSQLQGSPLWRVCAIFLLKRMRRPKAAISLMFDMNRLNVYTKGREKVICCERNSPLKRDPENFGNIRSLYERADHVVFQSTAVQDLFGERVRAHSSVLPNPVGVSCAWSSETTPRVVHIGRLNAQKNQALLLRAFAAFRRTHPEHTLSIYGKGERMEELRALARKLGIGDAVFFHGQADNVHEAIRDAEMFVLSSDYEGLSNALLECMMMGMPCISTACEGSTDVIRSGENGLLVPIGDEAALAEAMTRLADDRALRERLGQAAAATAARFRRETVAQEWMALLDRL